MKCYKLVFSLVLALSILFSGQCIGFAEDQFTDNLIPAMTNNTSPSGMAVSGAKVASDNHDAYTAFDGMLNGYGWAIYL